MVKVALISDSHGYMDEQIIRHCSDVDEIWHAGDIGNIQILKELPKNVILRVITGNIDDQDARMIYPEFLSFSIEGLTIGLLHIAGKPPRYAKGVKQLIQREGLQVLVCGHSHICKVEFDSTLQCLYMNPGAIGQQGFHQIRTLLKFEIQGGKIQHLRVVELGKRGR
ncbi:metallophosphoesterase family protein [Mongoliitalea daihaiensis]|uniref:metallophosphoesterase family protein n=1 Tax=Mongoliitalea daihaiensis TaxID=2782006 RepID=UPI001F3420DD|nr:metallophosphoesterase family protein [Mongoliitalea daihaiensis]UJP64849.1 metallophosphoesterase family protein [Mongoliitalea daihaiensis]